jgi:hypothetical protein
MEREAYMTGLLFTLLSGICWGQDVKAPEFTKFEFARERIGHKVVVDGTMANRTGAELVDVKLTAIYYDGDRELRRSKPAKVAKIAQGGTAPFTLEADNVPNFSRYELYAEYGTITRIYVGDEKAPMPSLKKAAPASLVLGGCKDVLPKSFPGDVVMTLSVRNAGGTEADEPTAVFVFKVRGQDQAVRVRLDKTIAAGTEDTYEVTIPGMEAYTAYEPKVTFFASEGPRPAESPENLKELVIRNFRAIRLNDGSARVTGSFKNGMAQTLGEVVAIFHLGKSEVPYKLPGLLAPGELRPFEFYYEGAGSLEGAGGYGVEFKEVPAGPAAPLRLPSVKKTATKVVEMKQVKVPPLPAKAKNDDPDLNLKDPKKQDYSIGIRGLMIVEGSYGKNGKYTGDLYLMRLIFLDDDGKVCKPTPTINVTTFNKLEPWGKAQRIVTKEQWNADASKISSLNAQNDTIACDKKSGELWVAFLRTEGPVFEPRADMTIVIPDVGIWAWRGLSGKFEVAAKLPDKK